MKYLSKDNNTKLIINFLIFIFRSASMCADVCLVSLLSKGIPKRLNKK